MVIDLHSHILPGVDDGAYTMADALEMARMAADSGVRTLVATPHYRYYGHDNHSQILETFDRLQDQLAYEQIPLNLVLGTEIWLAHDNCPTLESQMCYPDTQWFLAEFSVDESPENMDQILRAYADRGYRPVIAHPERYLAVLDDPIIAKHWLDRGWGVQINRDSLLGRFGKRCHACSEFMLAQGWVNLIASDAHWVDQRNTDWSEALEHLYRHYGHSVIKRYVEINPHKILANQLLQNDD